MFKVLWRAADDSLLKINKHYSKKNWHCIREPNSYPSNILTYILFQEDGLWQLGYLICVSFRTAFPNWVFLKCTKSEIWAFPLDVVHMLAYLEDLGMEMQCINWQPYNSVYSIRHLSRILMLFFCLVRFFLFFYYFSYWLCTLMYQPDLHMTYIWSYLYSRYGLGQG